MSDKEVTHIIQVRRGTMRVNFPFDFMGLVETWPVDLANSAVSALVMLQLHYPDRENSNPVDLRGTGMMVLKLPDRDGPLNPSTPLEYQLSGKWQLIDAEKLADLGAGGVQEVHGRCSFLVLELVDSLRAI